VTRLPRPLCAALNPVAELELVKQAVFTEPDDQSAWLYARCVLAWVLGGSGSPVVSADGGSVPGSAPFRSAPLIVPLSEVASLCASMVETCRELLEAEPGCKCELARCSLSSSSHRSCRGDHYARVASDLCPGAKWSRRHELLS
jgi:hypothetical protein